MTIDIDFARINPGPVGEDGLNDYQRSSLAFWIKWHGKPEYIIPILRAVKEDARMLQWADWPAILRFGIWLVENS